MSQQKASPFIFQKLQIVSINCQYKKMIYTGFLKAFWIAFSSKQDAGVSWERSNGAGEGEKELAFHSCVHATSSKTAKLLQLAGTQLCFLLKDIIQMEKGKMHHRSNTHGYWHNKNTDQNFKALYNICSTDSNHKPDFFFLINGSILCFMNSSL